MVSEIATAVMAIKTCLRYKFTVREHARRRSLQSMPGVTADLMGSAYRGVSGFAT
jgi:hypothetical protein